MIILLPMETVINCTLKEVVLQNFEKKLSCKDSENFQELIRGAWKFPQVTRSQKQTHHECLLEFFENSQTSISDHL